MEDGGVACFLQKGREDEMADHDRQDQDQEFEPAPQRDASTSETPGAGGDSRGTDEFGFRAAGRPAGHSATTPDHDAGAANPRGHSGVDHWFWWTDGEA